jgi:hypothetical protein
MNWKGCVRKWLWYCPGICLEGLRKTTKILSQDIPKSSEYEAGVVTTLLRRVLRHPQTRPVLFPLC